MNGELPLIAAGGSGAALLAGVHMYERRRDEAMRASRVRLGLRFPVGLEPLRAFAALGGLSGLPYTAELVAEVSADETSVRHALLVPRAVRSAAASCLTGAIPSLRVTEMDSSPTSGVTLTLKLFVATPAVLAAENASEVSRSLLTGMVGLRPGEHVVMRWALRPGSPRRWQSRSDGDQRQREIERAWRRKTTVSGFRVAGLVLLRAGTLSRARELAAHIESVMRSRRGLVGEVRITAGRGSRSLASLPRATRTSGWLSPAELLPLMSWPFGADVPVGVEVGAARELLVPRHVPRQGRALFVGRDVFGDRPVATDATSSLQHLLVAGGTGSGKSVLLTRAILSDIERGFGGVVIDPKADLLAAILNRVKPECAARIVVLDPGDTRPTPGLAMLSGGDPDFRADVLAGTLKAIFGSAWGVRSDFYGRLAIRTLAEVPGASLADLGRLFYEDGFRRAAAARLRDPFLVVSWQAYEALSAAARAEHVQAPMARVLALLSRPRIRAVLASPDAKLDIPRLLAERKWLLVSLAPGQLSEAGAAIVGASVMYSVWSAIEARVALPPERRHPIFIYVDELATLTNGLPFGFELLAERARGLGAGLAVAIQTLGRIPEPTRGALLGNVATFITFRASAEEAPRLARQLPGLSDADVMGLGRFEVAARVGVGIGSTVAVVTGRTEELPPETGMAEAIRDASAARYGSEPEPSPPDLVADSRDEPPIGRAGRGQ